MKHHSVQNQKTSIDIKELWEQHHSIHSIWNCYIVVGSSKSILQVQPLAQYCNNNVQFYNHWPNVTILQ
jgi:hypothetical protein